MPTPLVPDEARVGHDKDERSGPTRPAPPLPLRAGHRPAFPLHHLPARLQAIVGALAVATQTPVALAALIALAIIALACANRFVVRLRGAWREPVNLYLLVVLAPGNRKSAVVSFLTAPLDAYERDWNRQHTPAITASQNRRRVLEQKLARAQSEAARATGADYLVKLAEADALAQELAQLKVTLPLRLRIDDATPEAIASRLAEQGGRIGVISAEGGLFGNASRYSGGGEANTEVLLKAHSGDDTRVDRVGRPPEVIHAPALTIAIAAQLEVLRELGGAKSGFMGRGLPQRFAYALPESTVGRRRIDAPPVPVPIRADWDALVRTQLDLPVQTNAQGEDVPYEVTLSPDAQAVFDAFETRLEPELGEFGSLAAIAEWASKLAGAVGRLAGLFHAVEQAGQGLPWDAPISGATMTAAVAIAEEFLIPHALAAFGEMGADPLVADADYVRRWLAKKQVRSISKRDLFSETRGRFKKVAALEPVLALLIEHGYLHERPVEERPGPGRRPSPVYDVVLA